MEKEDRRKELSAVLFELPDDTFFYIMRNYLGPLKTPFHKPSLVKRLVGFLSKPEIMHRISLFLDEVDCAVLTAVYAMGNPSLPELFTLFSDKFEYHLLQQYVVNLEERLLILSNSSRGGLHINPLFLPFLKKHVFSVYHLFPFHGSAESQQPHRTEDRTEATPDFMKPEYDSLSGVILNNHIIPALISFYLHEAVEIGADGHMKRKYEQKLLQIAGESENPGSFLQGTALINQGLIALGIFSRNEGERSFMLSENFFDTVFQLVSQDESLPNSEILRVKVLVSGLCMQMGFARNQESFSFLLSILSFMHNFTNKPIAMLSLSCFIRAMAISHSITIDNVDSAQDPEGYPVVKSLLDLGFIYIAEDTQRSIIADPKLIVFFNDCRKLLTYTGKSETGSASLTRINNDVHLTIDSDFTVHPDESMPLMDILSLVYYAAPGKIDIKSFFEISKVSFMHAMDMGKTAETFLDLCNKLSMPAVPTHIVHSMKNWQAGYRRLSVHRGTVLQADPSISRIIESHPDMKQYIDKKLTDGLYLMKQYADADWHALLLRSGIDYVPNMTGRTTSNNSPEAPDNRASTSYTSVPSNSPHQLTEDSTIQDEPHGNVTINDFTHPLVPTPQLIQFLLSSPYYLQPPASAMSQERLKLVEELQEHLAGLKIENHSREEFSARIQKKLILSSSQLKGSHLHKQIWEARGLDYQGKITLCRNSLSSGRDLLEIHQKNLDNSDSVTLVQPVSLDNQKGDATLTGIVLPYGKEMVFRIRKISLLRKLRASLFSPD